MTISAELCRCEGASTATVSRYAFAPSIVGVIATSFDPTHGGHFAAGQAGQDLNRALLLTCTPALIIAGLIGIFGARWMATDIHAAEQVDKRARMAS